MLSLVLRKPDTLSCLPSITFWHDTKVCSKKVVKEGRFAGGLGAKDGYEVVVEAGRGDICKVEVHLEIRTMDLRSAGKPEGLGQSKPISRHT